jgi:periplasmic protein TonB
MSILLFTLAAAASPAPVQLAQAPVITQARPDAVAPPPPPSVPGVRPRPTPLGNPGVWITVLDYPTTSEANHEEGPVSFQMAVDQAGVATSCTIVTSSGFPALDQATCTILMLRARFNPATDAAGSPVAGTFRSRVRWVLPVDEPLPPATPAPEGR